MQSDAAAKESAFRAPAARTEYEDRKPLKDVTSSPQKLAYGSASGKIFRRSRLVLLNLDPGCCDIN